MSSSSRPDPACYPGGGVRGRAAYTLRWSLGCAFALLCPCIALASPGLRGEGGATVVYQQETDSGEHDTSVSADLFAFLPTRHGEWMLYVEASTATDDDSIFNLLPEINADAGSAQDSDGGSRVQISELNFRWDISGPHALTVGSIDPSAHLDRSRIANDENAHFLGASFVNNPTIEFPDYALGAMYRRVSRGAAPEITAILTSSDGLADNPSRSYRELVAVTEAGKGAFAGLGARWYLGSTRIGLGAWYRTDHHETLDDPDEEQRNYGAYALYGWQSGAHGVTLRAGLARASVSPGSAFLGAAYEGVTAYGALGLGIGHIFLSHSETGEDRHDTTQAELYFRISLGRDNVHLSPVLQYVKNPGFDSSSGAFEAEVVVAALRFSAYFGG